MDASRKPQSSADLPDLTEHLAGVDSLSTAPDHQSVRFYDSDQALARIVAEFLSEGFETGSPGIVIATASQRADIVQELTARSFDVVALQRSRDLVLLDGEEILFTFMVDGKPDALKFKDEICHLIETVSLGRDRCTVRLFGQMVDVLWQQGDRDGAIRLELLWNQLARTEAPSAVCAYALGSFFKDLRYEDVRAPHSRFVSTNETANRTLLAASDRIRPSSKRNGRR